MDLREEVLVHKLHLACEWWKYDVACCLISVFGADVNGLCRIRSDYYDDPVRSPLYRVCCPSGDVAPGFNVDRWCGLKLALKLIEHGADAGCRSADGHTPFMMAVMYNQYYIALLLLQNGADGRTPVVSESSQWENDPPLLQVVQANSLEHTPELVFALANEIIEHGGDVNEARAYVATATPLNYALSRSDRPEILELLLQRGAVLIPFSGVDEAVGFTHVPIVRLTQVDNRKHRVEDDVFEKAIMAAVRCLIQGGASLNWVNRQGDTALHAAYAAGHFDVAKQLVKAGADTTVRDAQGRLPKEAGKKGGGLRQQRNAIRRRHFMLFLTDYGLIQRGNLALGTAGTAGTAGAGAGAGTRGVGIAGAGAGVVAGAGAAGMAGAGVCALPVLRMLASKDVQRTIFSYL